MSNSENRIWSRDELIVIANMLEEFHKVFQVFWSLSSVEWAAENSRVKTAAVYFPPKGRSRMVVNREFWSSLSDDGKLFVIAHECLHVLLDHGLRNARGVEGATPKRINVAQDITINEIIREMFSFNRDRLEGWERFCWIDTVFAPDWQNVERNRNFLYYLDEIIKRGLELENVEMIDEHGGEGDSGYADDDAVDDMAGRLAQELSWDELQKMIQATEKSWGRGVSSSPFSVVLEAMTPTKLDFNKIVERLKRTAKGGKREKYKPSFAREARRFGTMSRDFILPGTIAKPNPKQKLLTATFFDVSGSCMSYFEHFMRVNAAFEAEPDLFELRQHVFDTAVTEVQRGHKLTIGGGTAFNIIEHRCRELEQEIGRYPDCVVVVTDGEGNAVSPKHSSRWVWLLTPNGKRSYIPAESQFCPLDKVAF